MNGEDWTSYEFQSAPPSILCQFRRKDGQHTMVFTDYAKNFYPEFNVSGLEWKLTGIAREELEGMSPEWRAQVMSPVTSPWMQQLLGSVSEGVANSLLLDSAGSRTR